MVLKEGYLFVIFVTFCADFPWCFACSAEESSSQEIAKDTKTNLGHKRARARDLEYWSGRVLECWDDSLKTGDLLYSATPELLQLLTPEF
jgi:hypothetical protein